METEYEHCRVCGAELPVLASTPFCYRHDPEFPIVQPSFLAQLKAVPPSYRYLVERDCLYEVTTCGDINFLTADRMLGDRAEYEALAQFPDLQPFGKSCGGDLWCWSTAVPDVEPPIFYVEYYGVSTPYAPDFNRFMYRTALEDASGRWDIDDDDLPDKLRGVADLLRRWGRADLANDLHAASQLPVRDLTSERRGVLTVAECRERIERFLGAEYLDSYPENV